MISPFLLSLIGLFSVFAVTFALEQIESCRQANGLLDAQNKTSAVTVCIQDSMVQYKAVEDLVPLTDFVTRGYRVDVDLWWMNLIPLVRTLANNHSRRNAHFNVPLSLSISLMLFLLCFCVSGHVR
eukprot:m.840053 g.840053  ORF g.840053 m.840053 type:complete len:126 (+) comp59507_c0_seq7:65-442(+)